MISPFKTLSSHRKMAKLNEIKLFFLKTISNVKLKYFTDHTKCHFHAVLGDFLWDGSAFKIILITVAFFSLFQFCCQEWPKQEQSAFTPDAQRFINMILDENPGASSDIDIIDSAISDGFREPVGYMLRLFVSDKVVFTNTIDSLRQNGVYRFWKSGYGTGSGMVDLEFRGIKVACDTLDSIDIISDSVIALERLELRWCNLTYLPPEIGKIRTKKLDISWNQGIIIPVEITQMDSLPHFYDILDIDFDQTWTAETFASLPEWAKDWLGKHNL